MDFILQGVLFVPGKNSEKFLFMSEDYFFDLNFSFPFLDSLYINSHTKVAACNGLEFSKKKSCLNSINLQTFEHRMRFNRSPPLLLNTQSKVCEKKPFEIIMKWLRLVLGVRGGERSI